MRKSVYIRHFLIILITSLFCSLAISGKLNSRKINILSWWGYLDHPEIIEEVKRECNVDLSVDEYYSNDEFIRRWREQKNNYDVIIFSDTVFNFISKELPRLKGNTLWKQATSYNPIIKKHYMDRHYPPNVLYFVHSVRGFLWNPANISISPTDSILSIFSKAKNKYVVIMDDPFEVQKLIEQSVSGDNYFPRDSALSKKNFRRVIQDSIVYITNNYSQIYKKQNFAFSFSWSGEAVFDLVESQEKYQFLIHPKISYISSDLISQASNRRGAYCVSKLLASKKILTVIQNKDYYFSPYVDFSKEKNIFFIQLYKEFTSNLSELQWADAINEKDFQEINKSWQLIKLFMIDHKREN